MVRKDQLIIHDFSARYYVEKNKKLKRVKHDVWDEKKDETSAVNAYKEKK